MLLSACLVFPVSLLVSNGRKYPAKIPLNSILQALFKLLGSRSMLNCLSAILLTSLPLCRSTLFTRSTSIYP